MSRPPRIRLNINALRVQGASPDQAHVLAASLKAGLAQQFAANPNALATGGQARMQIRLPQAGTAQTQGRALGAQIGNQIGAGFRTPKGGAK